MEAMTLEQRLALTERRYRTLTVKQRRMERAQHDQGEQLAEIKRGLGRLHATMAAGLFTLLAALVGGVFDLLAHMH